MTAQLQAQVTAPFRIAGAGQIPLAIQGDSGLYADSDIHLLLTPNVAAELHASPRGAEVRLGGSKIIDVPGGVLTFSNSDTAALPFVPTESNPEFSPGIAFDSLGQPVSVSAFYDAPAFSVRASRKFTGSIDYSAYQTTARILTYTPLVETFGDGARTTFGSITAYYRGSLLVYQVQPTTILNGAALIELYRIYSYKVITHDGEFEAPPTYPTSGAYPGKTLVIDTDGWKFERPHEIGYIDDQGHAYPQTPNVQILEPYVGDGTYTPTKFKRIATLDPTKYPPEIIAKANDFVRSRGLGKV